MIAEYEKKIKDLEDKLAAEIRKMEDSSGYLKKMYEEKINNYEAEIKSLKEQLGQEKCNNENLTNKIKDLEKEL